jgi:outer membrane protein assembly factor BamB
LRKAYSTPGIVEVGGRKQVVSVGSKAAFGYDALTGAEIWTVRHDDYNAAARPIFFAGMVILNTGGRGANLTAYRLDESTQGDVTESHLVWDIPKGNARLATPILFAGRVYMVTDRGVVKCVDARDGSEIFAGRIDGNFVASPIVANGNLYFCNEAGETFVVAADDEFELLATGKLEEGMRASPAAANGALFLRTFHRLYKIQQD